MEKTLKYLLYKLLKRFPIDRLLSEHNEKDLLFFLAIEDLKANHQAAHEYFLKSKK